ncbi:hypothetical protein HID58_059091 [Brassica napus]|uniref:SGS domain-containing protein n=1 Tax=Brassica napus TaxID=3708 RepID=A0ABQ7ZRW7_BRANA|nr:hypothetical protein HID58_059091 [Brassica napus]
MRSAYHSSKKKNDKVERDTASNKFFREIYLNSDEDMRILHNQLESIGTVLPIDWKDVGAKKIESTLHDDLALKTWEI